MRGIAKTAVTAALLFLFAAPNAFAAFGISSFSATVMKDATHVQTQAGSTPDVGITDFTLNSDLAAVTDPVQDIRVDLPPGLISNPQATPTKCASLGSCDATTQIGTVDITVAGLLPVTGIPVYNMAPPAGTVSDFAFDGAALGLGATHIIGGVRDTGDYGLFFTIHNASGLPITHSKLTFFGNPAAHGTGAPAAPFIRLPTTCAGPQTTKLTVVSTSGVTATSTDTTKDDNGDPIGATGCDQVPFAPTLAVTPSSTQRDAPVGATIDVGVPWQGDPAKLASSHVKDTVVTLPPGMSISPSAANGLEACTDDQFAQGTHDAIACPAASKVGTAEIRTPVLPGALKGSVYLGAPQADNPYRLFVVADGFGLSVRLKGTVAADPKTGQLTTTFADTPQVPFSDFILNLNPGPNATLASPLACGDATTTSQVTPYSGTAAAAPTSSYTVDLDGTGGACPATPFGLGFSAGTQPLAAGAFAPFTLNVTRDDGQQYLSGLTIEEPPGLLGVLQNVPLCAEADAAAGSCAEASRVGTSTVTSGPGSAPFTITGPVYLTGPYGGAPFGLAIVIHVVAGPFDLGTVVVRSAIRVDPDDAHLTIATPALPTILRGIPLRLRSVTVAIDRSQFIFNPTSCGPMAVGATLSSDEGATQAVSSPFQASGCDALPYAPKMTLKTRAAVRPRPASLSVTLSQSPGEANSRSVSVHLPTQLGARFDTLGLACPEATFKADPAGCGAGSKVGTVSAATPVLAAPLTGTVYLEAHPGGKLPTLEAVMQGSGISVDLSGTFTLNNGITSTFATVPDVPITSFTLNLPAGEHSALSASTDLCVAPLPFSATMLGQNGKQVTQSSTAAVAGCGVRITSAKVKRTVATLKLRVPARGKLAVSGKGLRKARKVVKTGGVYTVRVKLSKAGKKALRRARARKHKRARRLVVRLKVAYAPAKGAVAGGEPVKASRAARKLKFK